MAGVTRNLIIALTSTARGISQGFDQARREIGKFDVTVRKTNRGSLSQFGSRIDSVGQSLAGLAAVAGGAFAAAKVVDFAQDSVRAFSDLEESINAVNVTFEDGADQILAFGENAAQSVGLAQSAFNQAVIPIGALFRNFGFEADDAADSAIELTQRAADIASVFNVDVKEALTAVGAALRGESEPLRRFGADISAARVESFLLSEGIVSSKSEIDEAAKVFGRYQLILQDTARTAGDFAATSDSYANQQRILAAEFENVQARIGEALLPAFQAIVGAAPEAIEVLEALVPTIEGVARSFSTWAPGAAEAVSGVLEQLAALPAGLGELKSLFESFSVDLLAGILGNIPIVEGFSESFINDLEVAKGAREQTAAEFNALNQAIIQSFDIGAPNAASNALLSLQQDGRLVESAWRRVIDGLNLTDDEIVEVARNLESVGVSLGRSFIADELDRIETAAYEVGEASRFAARAGRDLGSDLDDAGVSASEFYGTLESPPDTDPVVEEFEKLQESVIKTIDLFAEAPEEIEASVDDLINRSAARAEQNNRLQAALGVLAAAGVDSVVRELQDAGPAAAGVAEDLANDIVRAFELEEQLESEVGSALDVVSASVSNATPSLARIFAETGIDLARALELGFTNEILAGGIANAISRAPRQGNAPSGSRSGPGGIEARAMGGPVSAMRPYIVGERGPELFVPQTSGQIYPTGTSVGGGNVQNVTINVTSPQPVMETDIQRAVLLSGIARTAEVARI